MCVHRHRPPRARLRARGVWVRGCGKMAVAVQWPSSCEPRPHATHEWSVSMPAKFASKPALQGARTKLVSQRESNWGGLRCLWPHVGAPCAVLPFPSPHHDGAAVGVGSIAQHSQHRLEGVAAGVSGEVAVEGGGPLVVLHAGQEGATQGGRGRESAESLLLSEAAPWPRAPELV